MLVLNLAMYDVYIRNCNFAKSFDELDEGKLCFVQFSPSDGRSYCTVAVCTMKTSDCCYVTIKHKHSLCHEIKSRSNLFFSYKEYENHVERNKVLYLPQKISVTEDTSCIKSGFNVKARRRGVKK